MDHIKNRPITHSIVSGPNAKGYFSHLLALYFHEEVKGILHSVSLKDGEFISMRCTGCRTEAIATALNHNLEIKDVDHFILDCENQHGDTWRATYYLEYQITTFVKMESADSLRRQYGPG